MDEVHAVGLYGDQGPGIGEKKWCVEKMDIITGTFGKAFGNIGGYVAGAANTIDMIRNYAAGFIFTTSLPPSTLARALAAIRVLRSEDGKRLRISHQTVVGYMREKLIENGIPVIHGSIHIIPILVGNAALSMELTDYPHARWKCSIIYEIDGLSPCSLEMQHYL